MRNLSSLLAIFVSVYINNTVAKRVTLTKGLNIYCMYMAVGELPRDGLCEPPGWRTRGQTIQHPRDAQCVDWMLSIGKNPYTQHYSP